MSELEIKEVLTEFTRLFNTFAKKVPEEVAISFLSRLEDIFKHIEALLFGHEAEIECLKIRVKKLENMISDAGKVEEDNIYPMTNDDKHKVQLECRDMECSHHTMYGECINESPAITLNIDGTYVCWSKKEKETG